METANQMLPLTEAFYYILVALYGGPSHGYAIMQDVEKMSGGRVTIGAGTLYTALGTLSKKGLVESVESVDGADSRRKMYAITEVGRQVFAAELTRLKELLQNGKNVMEKTRRNERE